MNEGSRLQSRDTRLRKSRKPDAATRSARCSWTRLPISGPRDGRDEGGAGMRSGVTPDQSGEPPDDAGGAGCEPLFSWARSGRLRAATTKAHMCDVDVLRWAKANRESAGSLGPAETLALRRYAAGWAAFGLSILLRSEVPVSLIGRPASGSGGRCSGVSASRLPPNIVRRRRSVHSWRGRSSGRGDRCGAGCSRGARPGSILTVSGKRRPDLGGILWRSSPWGEVRLEMGRRRHRLCRDRHSRGAGRPRRRIPSLGT